MYCSATVAQDYSTYWVSVVSPLDVRRRPNENDNFVPPARVTTTTPPNFTPIGNKESATEFDPFYKGCDVEKTCFGAPAKCISTKNCKVAVAVTVLGDKYEFELKANNDPAWVGVGLSDDASMGQDSVIECVREGGSVKAYMSYTSPRPNLNVKRLNKVNISCWQNCNEKYILHY